MKIVDNSVHNCAKHINAKIYVDTDIIHINMQTYKYTYYNEK